MELSDKVLERSTTTNLILDQENGDGFQDSFEGTKCVGWPLREVDRGCETPKTPVDPASLLN